jgi:hypothetical protein
MNQDLMIQESFSPLSSLENMLKLGNSLLETEFLRGKPRMWLGILAMASKGSNDENTPLFRGLLEG